MKKIFLITILGILSFATIAQTNNSYTPPTIADSSCVIRNTRAAIRALRTAGNLDVGCHYVITDPSADGNLDVQEVILHAVNANTLGTSADIYTSHYASAYSGVYDIDQDDVLQVTDHNENEVTTNNSILSFPFGVNTVRDNVVSGNAILNYTGGTVDQNTLKANSNTTVSGGTFSENTVGEDATVTITSGSNYENVFGASTVYNQVGTGYIRYSTIEGTNTWTNGNTNISNVESYNSTVNTTGSAGTISNSLFNRAYLQNMQNIASLTITDFDITSYGQVSANGATRLYLYRGSNNGSRILTTGASRLDASYTNLQGYSYLQSTNGSDFRVSYAELTSGGYARNITGNLNYLSRVNIESNSNMRFDGSANNCRIYYSSAVAGATIYHTGTSNGCYIYNGSADGASQIYTTGSTNARIYYSTANSRGRIYSQNNTATHYIYYCHAAASGYVFMINNTGSMRMYSISASSQSIARLQNSTANGNWYYSSVDAYFYAYITRNGGTSSGLFGQGRRTQTITNPVNIPPYALGNAWLNF